MAAYGYQQLFQDAVTDTGTTALYSLGTERIQDGKRYIYVYNNSTGSIAVKKGCRHKVSTTNFYADMTTSAGNGCLGVAETALAASSYGWIITDGPAEVTMGDSSALAGSLIYMGTNGVMEQIAADNSSAQHAAACVGVAIDAIAAGGTGTALIRTMG